MTLPKITFNYIKSILKDYPDLDKHIKKREEELRYPYKSTDVNGDIKSSNKNMDSMGTMLITIEEDERLNQLTMNRKVIEHNLSIANADTVKIINELYIAKYPQYTMDGLVQQCLISCGRSKAYDLRDKFFKLVARELNLPM